ncbi:helicase-associated domain-containing protein [Microbacterium sp. NPDC055903]
MSTHARPLAVWLAAAENEQLERLFAGRRVRPDAPWHDFFDAAEALLDPASIDRALQSVDDAEARALISGSAAGQARLIALGLVGADGTPPPPVAALLAERTAPVEADDAPAPPATHAASAYAAERAFTNVAAIADLLLATRESPLPLIAGGTLGASERRRIAETGIPAEDISPLLALASAARLVRPYERALRLTRSGDAWLRLSAAERWAALATAFRDALPGSLRTPEGGWLPMPTWQAKHPWDPSWPERSVELLHQAALLGLVIDDGSEPEWAAALRRGGAADPASLATMLPAEVDQVFLQNDLSAISPGPLRPSLDVRLRTMAVRESAAQASSYRFTAESLTRALGEGETGESLTEFLGRLSITGIPQPLQYLITQTASRHGLVRISTTGDGLTTIGSTDRTMIDAIAVDQALRPLGLHAEGEGLVTRVGAETVYWALTDARYPATMVDAGGHPITAERELIDDERVAPSTGYATLIARLRKRQGPDADAAWLDRELDAAVRQRAVVLIEVAMPDGSTRELTLEASGLGGGRLRGRDRAADVERTLPVSSIRSARILPQ